MPVDRRIQAIRKDLADVRLAERAFAPHYAAAVTRGIALQTPLYADHHGEAPPLSEVLPGDRFEMLELSGDHAWGICVTDGAVGYVPVETLCDPVSCTHVVAIASTPVHATPHADGPVVGALPMDARVEMHMPVAFAQVALGYVDATALRPIDVPATDVAAVAEALVGVPFRAGGRSGTGVDAGGLLFLACDMTGVRIPRFLDLQAASVGMPLDSGAMLQRGDLVYFQDHATIMVNEAEAIHVNDMSVEQVSLETLIASGRYGPVLARRRIA